MSLFEKQEPWVRPFIFKALQSISPSAFSPNAEKYGPEKLRIWTLFTQ